MPIGGECPSHPKRLARPNATDRGYDRKWRLNRARFLATYPVCIDCGQPAQVPDHDPIDRVDLVARGEPHPDAWRWLKPRCISCHNARTARRAAIKRREQW